MSKPADSIFIDSVTIRLSSGWQSDPVYLARRIAEQIQQQAGELSSAKQIELSLQGHFAGNARNVAEQLSSQLGVQQHKTKERGHR